MDCAWTLLVKSLDHYVYVAINRQQIKKKSCGQQIRLFDTGCLHVWMSANVSMWRGIVAKDSIILIKVWIKKKKKSLPFGLSTTLNYYSTSRTAKARPNYNSHFVKVPSCSICSMNVCTGSDMHMHTHQVQHFRQTGKGRSRYIFPSGYTFVDKNS